MAIIHNGEAQVIKHGNKLLDEVKDNHGHTIYKKTTRALGSANPSAPMMFMFTSEQSCCYFNSDQQMEVAQIPPFRVAETIIHPTSPGGSVKIWKSNGKNATHAIKPGAFSFCGMGTVNEGYSIKPETHGAHRDLSSLLRKHCTVVVFNNEGPSQRPTEVVVNTHNSPHNHGELVVIGNDVTIRDSKGNKGVYRFTVLFILLDN